MRKENIMQIHKAVIGCAVIMAGMVLSGCQTTRSTMPEVSMQSQQALVPQKSVCGTGAQTKASTEVCVKKAPAKVVNMGGCQYAYKVKKGETVESIARKYGSTPDRIRALNHLDTAKTAPLRAGQLISLPSECKGKLMADKPKKCAPCGKKKKKATTKKAEHKESQPGQTVETGVASDAAVTTAPDVTTPFVSGEPSAATPAAAPSGEAGSSLQQTSQGAFYEAEGVVDTTAGPFTAAPEKKDKK